jgi:hypothetical protein
MRMSVDYLSPAANKKTSVTFRIEFKREYFIGTKMDICKGVRCT